MTHVGRAVQDNDILVVDIGRERYLAKLQWFLRIEYGSELWIHTMEKWFYRYLGAVVTAQCIAREFGKHKIHRR